MKKILVIIVAMIMACAGLMSCVPTSAPGEPNYADCAVRIAQSEMMHNPELWMADFLSKPKWDYTQGLIAQAMLETYRQTGDTTYLNYVLRFADYFIQDDGSILTYKLESHNLDRLNGGNFLFFLDSCYPGEQKYASAIRLLRSQLLTQPRTTEGGFWHKQIYPWQMWLDGLYMAEPFYAHYAVWANEDSIYNDVVRQFHIVDKHTLNVATGLNYHGWDESIAQAWADGISGCSAHTWGRAEGWYVMAICDVLDYLPKNHAGRDELIAILNRVCRTLAGYQDAQTKMWYQIPDMPDAEGNYTESTCTAMFCYAMAKGARMGYLPEEYLAIARSAFAGMWANAVETNEDGTLSLKRCCAVAGLGGNPYRSGTYDYYINERVRDDDPKGIGPLILAAWELNKSKDKQL